MQGDTLWRDQYSTKSFSAVLYYWGENVTRLTPTISSIAVADFDPNITKPMARPQASPTKVEREGRVKMMNNTENVSQARIKEAKQMAWMTNHF